MEPKIFGQYLKSLRERMSLTMRELDKRSGVSHSYISQLERGERGASPEILTKLAGPLGKTVTELMVRAGHIPESEFTPISGPQSAFDVSIRSFVHLLIGDREHPFLGSIEREFDERLGALFTRHNVKSTKTITFNSANEFNRAFSEQYADMIIDVDNAQFKWDVLQELQDIAHDFHLRFNPAYEVGTRQPRPKKLENIVERESITYNNQSLTESDRQRILNMLKLIFPDSQ